MLVVHCGLKLQIPLLVHPVVQEMLYVMAPGKFVS